MCFEKFIIFVDLLTRSLVLRILDAFEFLVSLEMTLYANMLFRFNLLIGI